jgi:peptidoglycan/LPS O-acetylase OafA/YrhL
MKHETVQEPPGDSGAEASAPALTHTDPPTNSALRWTALDGLRAVAVTAVIAYHLGLRSPEGQVGVDLFFVLSGFLITSLLLKERDHTGRVSLGNFWRRRALRLFPALACAIVVALVVSLFSSPEVRSATIRGLPAVILYFGNWVRSLAPASDLGLLGHTWSLAVEEQFYIVWPLLCVGLICRMSRHRAAALISVLAVLDSVYFVFAIHRWGQAAIAFRTDTRGMGLLAGAGLALWVIRRGEVMLLHPRMAFIWRRVGIAALLLFLLLTQVTPRNSVMNGVVIGLAVWSSVVVVASVVLGGPGRLSTILSSRPLRWIGQRSYGIYLYHYPFAMTFVEDRSYHGLTLALVDMACIAAAVALAAASYRWVEQPFLRRKARFSSLSLSTPVGRVTTNHSDPNPPDSRAIGWATVDQITRPPAY